MTTQTNSLIQALKDKEDFLSSVYMTYSLDDDDHLEFDEQEEFIDFFNVIEEIYYLYSSEWSVEAYFKKNNYFYLIEFSFDEKHYTSFSIFYTEKKEKILQMKPYFEAYLCNKNLIDKLNIIEETKNIEEKIKPAKQVYNHNIKI
jgi:hypothetical protein